MIEKIGKIFICFICKLLVTETMQLTCVSIYQYRSSYIIKHWPAGNFTVKNESIRAYYRSIPRESSIKRITRIVSQNLQKAKQLTATTSKSKTAMSQILDNRMRYAKKSQEERKPAKFSQAACLKEDTCSSGTDADADLPGEDTPHRLSENRTNLRKSAPGSDSGHRRRPTWRTRRCCRRPKCNKRS